MNYLIRTTTKRSWYVNNFLVPELESQGCGRRNIYVYVNDSGNLESFIQMCKFIVENYKWNDFIWVLQDDVYPCDNFHYITNKYSCTEANGFCSGFDNIKNDGYVPMKQSWLSFQCKNFRVDKIKLFLMWYDCRSEELRQYIRTGKMDDTIYNLFEQTFKNDYINNISPNIVEHIDYLIGGSIVNKNRTPEDTEKLKSQNFEDKEKIEKLKEKLNEDTN